MNQRKNPQTKPQPKDWRDEPFEDFIRKIDPGFRKK